MVDCFEHSYMKKKEISQASRRKKGYRDKKFRGDEPCFWEASTGLSQS